MTRMKKLNFTVVGDAPLLTHNGRLAANNDPYARKMGEISSKRKKTDADYEELARLEFLGGLYLNEDDEPCIPARVFEACIIGRGSTARQSKLGKSVAAAVWVDDSAPLQYDGPRNPDKLWKEGYWRQDLVKVRTSRVMRTRGQFKDWSADFTVLYDPDMVNEDELKHWIEDSGITQGLGDWRPQTGGHFGRFSVEWKNGQG